MTDSITKMKNKDWVDKESVFEGGKGGLARLDPSWKLYVLCHGHAALPLFTTNAGKWDARAMAAMMVKDGLKTSHRTIELLVCHAGHSVTDQSAVPKRESILSKLWQTTDENKRTQIKKQVDKVLAKGPMPTTFTHERQVLPLVAQLVRELKAEHFNDLFVTAYAAPVCQYFDYGAGVVCLDTSKMGGRWGAYDEKTLKQYKVNWM